MQVIKVRFLVFKALDCLNDELLISKLNIYGSNININIFLLDKALH